MFHSVNTFFHKDLLYPSSSASTSTRPCPSRATTKYNSAEHFWIQELTLICLKSSLNPIIYCWKIREVRQPVKETIRRQFFVVHRQRRNHRLKKSWNGKQNKTATLLAQSLDPLLVLLPNTVRRLEFFMTWGRCFSPILQRVLGLPFTAFCTPHLLGRALGFVSQAAMIGFGCLFFDGTERLCFHLEIAKWWGPPRTHYTSEYLKDHKLELRRKIWRHNWSSEF